MTDLAAPDTLAGLFARWDRQQAVYIRDRDRAFALMIDVLDDRFSGPIDVLDLACGTGSISARVLARRPDATCTALDVDPVLQAVGRAALAGSGDRLTWLTADLRDPSWTRELDGRSFDAVLTATALHWLSPAELTDVYTGLAALLRPGAVLLNFDGFRLTGAPSVTATIKNLDTARQEVALGDGAEGWQDWWDAARGQEVLAAEFARRDEIFAPAAGQVFSGVDRRAATTFELHAAVLDAAGFAEVGCVWQDLHKKILLAVR